MTRHIGNDEHGESDSDDRAKRLADQAERLRHVRDATRLNRVRFAAMVGVSQQSWGRWEAGRNFIAPEEARRIAQVLDLPETSVLGPPVDDRSSGEPGIAPELADQAKRLKGIRDMALGTLKGPRQRAASPFTHERIASALGVSVATVSNWFRGLTPLSLARAVELADYFNVPVADVLGYEPPAGTEKRIEKRLSAIEERLSTIEEMLRTLPAEVQKLQRQPRSESP